MRTRSGVARLTLMVASLGLSSPARASVDPALVGTWTMEGAPLTLTIDASGRCSLNGETATCTGSAGTLTMIDSAGEVSTYAYAIRGGALELSGGEILAPITLRSAGRPSAPPPTRAPKPAAPEPGPGPAKVSARPPSGPGTPFSKDAWGVRLTIPPGWKGAETGGVLVMGSDSEAGLLMVRFLRKVTAEQLASEYKKGFHEQGVSLAPSGDAKPFRSPGGTGSAGELAGTGPDGAQLRARSVAVLSKWGGAIVVVGLTTEDRFGGLRPRVDAIAQSVTFVEPKAPKGAEVLAGRFEYVYVAKTGGYSRESKITLCADGRFSKGGEIASSGAAGSAVSSHGNQGTWSSEGDEQSGQVTLQYDSGQSETLAYRVSNDPRDRSGFGPAVVIGSTKYQRTGSGDCR